MPRHLCRLASLAALPLLIVACSAPGSGPGAQAGAGRGGRGAGGAVPVLTARVEQKAMPVTLPAVGTVEAISSVQIRAQVTGQLSAVQFSEGQEVAKGQPLFSLDARPFQAALQQAEAVLARDAATLQNAQAQEARSESLFQRGLIPRDQYESQRASVSALVATVGADKAAIDIARLNLQYTNITAPTAGRTGVLGAHAGDLVRANDTTPLVVINQMSPIYVTFSVPGRYLGDIRRYQGQKPLRVSADSPAGDTPAQGAVSFVDNTVDPATATIRLKATFENADRQLWPGAFVQVTLLLTTDADALVVPAVAVQASQDGQYVYVVKADRTVELRPVQTERQQGDQMVIAKGVAAGEVVVTDGHLRLTPGARVSERGAGTAQGRGGSAPPDAGGPPTGK
jgi:membrane fusion protein, multidrug efflux system